MIKKYNFICSNCGGNKFKKLEEGIYECEKCGRFHKEKMGIDNFADEQKDINLKQSPFEQQNKDECDKDCEDVNQCDNLKIENKDIEREKFNQDENNIIVVTDEFGNKKTINLNDEHFRKISFWYKFFITLFFGMFGAHKFIEGKIGLGLVYFFTYGFCGVGVIVDLIVLIVKSVKNKTKN